MLEVRPTLNAIEADATIRMKRGVRQGSPLSGLLFIMILSDVLRPLETKWAGNQWGCYCGALLWYNHLLFADDLVLIGKDSGEIRAMLADLQEALALVGLETNESKFQFVYGPMEEWMRRETKILPGTDQSEKGMIVLGRLLKGGTITEDIDDLRMKKAKGWGRYHAYKKILRHHTSRRHKLHLVESCILQAVLWMANTWKPTQQICRELRGFHLAVLRAVFPKAPGPRPENCHPTVHQSRWILSILQEEKRHLADVLFLQRFHRWAGHLARTQHSPLRQLVEYRDGAWWHKQHLSPWGLRHEGDRGNFQRWDQSLTDLRGVGWKELAADRKHWKKLEIDLILLFQKPLKRTRNDGGRGHQSDTTQIGCQVTQEVSTDGRQREKGNDEERKNSSQVTQMVSTLQERYKRKYTRQRGILKEYLVPLGTSAECAPGHCGKKLTRHFAAEETRRKNSSSWSRALSAVRPEQPLIDLVIQPLASHQQGGYDVFGSSSRLGRRRGSARNDGRAKGSRCAGRPGRRDSSGCGRAGGSASGARSRGEDRKRRRQRSKVTDMERHIGSDAGRLHPTAPSESHVGARFRRRDPEPGGRGRIDQGERGEGEGRSNSTAARSCTGRRKDHEEEARQAKRRRRTAKEAMEELARGTAENPGIQRQSGSYGGGAASSTQSGTSLSGAGSDLAAGLPRASICRTTMGEAKNEKLDVARKAQQQPATPKPEEKDTAAGAGAGIASQSTSSSSTSDSDTESEDAGGYPDYSGSASRGAACNGSPDKGGGS